jgi:hypothetical protein
MNFDAKTVEPSTGFDPIPDGEYLVMVEKAEEKPTKAEGGEQLVLQLKVIEGKYAKRVIFARINLQNKSAKCVEIGRAELSAFCRATGVLTPKAAFEFANRLLKVAVKVVKRQDNGELSNQVTKYMPSGSGVAGLVTDGTSKASQPVQSASPAAPAPAPWAKTN